MCGFCFQNRIHLCGFWDLNSSAMLNIPHTTCCYLFFLQLYRFDFCDRMIFKDSIQIHTILTQTQWRPLLATQLSRTHPGETTSAADGLSGALERAGWLSCEQMQKWGVRGRENGGSLSTLTLRTEMSSPVHSAFGDVGNHISVVSGCDPAIAFYSCTFLSVCAA